MDTSQAAELIWSEAAQGRWFPEALRGTLDFASAHQVQLAVLEKRQAGGDTLAGWKVGFTSERVRAKYGTDERPFGHLMASGVHASNATVPIFPHAAIEPELCFTIGSRLGAPDVTPEQARAAVAGVAAGFELNQGRARGVEDTALAIADNLSQWGIVHGGALAPIPADFDLNAISVTLRKGGQQVSSVVGREVIDDHFLSLSLLARNLHRHGLALEPGQRVITGSFDKVDVGVGESWEAEFSGIGTVAVSFV